jgi:hypothetical protein
MREDNSALDAIFNRTLDELEFAAARHASEPPPQATIKLAYLFLRGLRLAGVKPSQLLYSTDGLYAFAAARAILNDFDPAPFAPPEQPTSWLDKFDAHAMQCENKQADDTRTTPPADYVIQPGQTMHTGDFAITNRGRHRLYIKAEL